MSVLEKIAAYKREEVATAKKARPLRMLMQDARHATAPRGFGAALEQAAEDQQPLIDSYVRGDGAADATRIRVPPMFRELLTAIRDINQGVPSMRQVRVIAGALSSGPDVGDGRPIALRRQVLDAGQRALVHLWLGACVA